jgi:hypothetical protein
MTDRHRHGTKRWRRLSVIHDALGHTLYQEAVALSINVGNQICRIYVLLSTLVDYNSYQRKHH